MINAVGNDCVVATVTMVCMYWRQRKQDLDWKLPLDFEHQKWKDFYKKGLTYVRTSGMPANNIKRFLSKLELPLSAKLVLLEDKYGLRNLIDTMVPPIVFYDHTYFLKNVRGPGHAVILVDQTDELFISVDPSLGPKYYSKPAKTDFEEAWKLDHNATIILLPKIDSIIERKIPSQTKSLMPYLTSNPGDRK